MSATPSKPSSSSSSKTSSHKKDKSSSRSERRHTDSPSSTSDKKTKHKSTTNSTPAKSSSHMDADEIVDELLQSDNSSISSMDVSDDDVKQVSDNHKKRRRADSDNEQDQDDQFTETILMKRVGVKKAAIESSAIQGDDVQLWLFKLPESMDETTLNGVSMSMGGTVRIGGVEYSISEGSALESDSLVNIWPDTETGKMVLGKPFTKIVHVSEAPKSTETQANQIVTNLAAFLKFGTTRSPIAAQNYDDLATPELKVRYVPGGASLPVDTESRNSGASGIAFNSSSRSSHSTHVSAGSGSSHKHKESKHKHKEGKHKHKESKH